MTTNVEPMKVDKGIWFMLARSQDELKDYKDAIEASKVSPVHDHLNDLLKEQK